MHKNRCLLFTLGIFLLSVVLSPYIFVAFAEEIMLTGVIERVESNKLVIDGDTYQLSKEPLIIFTNSNGSELIENPNLIPPDVTAQFTLNDDGKILSLIFFKSYNDSATLPKREIIWDFTKNISNFRVSPNEQYIAYYSEDELLSVINIESMSVIWQSKTNSPVYNWKPNKNSSLTYINKNDNYVELINLEFPSFTEKQLFKINSPYTFIDKLWWSPLGNYFGLLKITGEEDAHGYSELAFFDQQGNLLFKNIFNVNSLSWSQDENFVAISKYKKDDYSESEIQLIKFKTKEIIVLPFKGKIQTSPFFSWDNNGIFYSMINELDQELFHYDYINNINNLVFRDLKYLDNFLCLKNKEILYTAGSLPQLVIFDTQNKNLTILDQGFQPEIIGNHIYYLKNSIPDQKTRLYKYTWN